MDRLSTDILQQQQLSPLNRKRLAEMTKDFRQTPDPEKPTAVGALVKAYQGEIDSLTKRCSATESEFLSLYKLLLDLPDVSAALSSALDSLNASSTERNKLQEQMQENKVKVEYYESKMEDVIRQRVNEREQELAQMSEAKAQISKDREDVLKLQVTELTNQIQMMQSTLSESHSLVEAEHEKWTRELSSRRSDAEMLQRDLDASNRRAQELHAELTTIRSSDQTLAPSEEARHRETINALKQEVDRLRIQITDMQQTHNNIQHAHESAKAHWQATTIKKEAQIANLTDKLAQFADYDTLRKELDALKQVELGDAWQQPLDTGILSRNHELLNKLTVTSNQLSSLEEAHTKLQTEMPKLEKTIKDQEQLIRTLEDDLRKTQSNDILPSSTTLSTHPLLSPLSAGISSEGVSASQQSMMKILTNQRDRFRQRNQELEEELRIHLSTLADLRHQVSMLQEDNVGLYEKIKYLQNYSLSNDLSSSLPFGSSSVSQRHGGSIAIEMNALNSGNDQDFDDKKEDSKGKGKESARGTSRQGGILRKYRDIYEEKLNPFDFFRRNEQSLRYTSLSGTDKATLNVSKLLLANKHTRLFVFVYSICLHVLVFATLYHFALGDIHSYSPQASGSPNMGMGPSDDMLAGPRL